ncbi:MAG: YkoF family thiamine/hydroxymethylpyrimidine-binding protein [Bacillota bacterium]
MCSLDEERIASCQITYFPVQSTHYLDEINKVLDLIKSYPVQYEIGMLATTIKGESDTIFKLIQEIFNVMDEEGCHFTLNMMVSNICGCKSLE